MTLARKVFSLLLVLLTVIACQSNGGTVSPEPEPEPEPEPPPPEPTVTYHVQTVSFAAGGDGGAVSLYRVTDGIPDRDDHVPEAVVKVNGTVLPFLDREPYMNFQGPLDTGTISVGDTLDLHIEIGADVITAEWTIPAPPVVTGPADGKNFAVGEPVLITWDAPEDPTYFRGLLLGDVTGGGWSGQIDGSERSWDVDLSRLPTDGSDIRLSVISFNVVEADGFTGPVADSASVTGESRTSLLETPTFSVGP